MDKHWLTMTWSWAYTVEHHKAPLKPQQWRFLKLSRHRSSHTSRGKSIQQSEFRQVTKITTNENKQGNNKMKQQQEQSSRKTSESYLLHLCDLGLGFSTQTSKTAKKWKSVRIVCLQQSWWVVLNVRINLSVCSFNLVYQPALWDFVGYTGSLSPPTSPRLPLFLSCFINQY